MTNPDTRPDSVGQAHDDNRTLAQFFFEHGFWDCYAEAMVVGGRKPFALPDDKRVKLLWERIHDRRARGAGLDSGERDMNRAEINAFGEAIKAHLLDGDNAILVEVGALPPSPDCDALSCLATVKGAVGIPVAGSVGYGDRKQTIWFDVTKWGKGADSLARMLLKGTKVTVSGELSEREHEGKRYLQIRADHVALQGERQAGQQSVGGSGSQSRPSRPPFDDNLDDDVPFVSADPAGEGRVS